MSLQNDYSELNLILDMEVEKNIRLRARIAALEEALIGMKGRMLAFHDIAFNHIFDKEDYGVFHRSMFWNVDDQEAFERAEAALKKE